MESQPETDGRETAAASWRSLHVLLVEDNPGDARLVREMMRDYPEITMTVDDTLAASITRLNAGGVDIVLLDLGLPDSQGLATLSSLTAAHPSLPVVALTGLDDDRLAFAAVQAGAQDYLSKQNATPETIRRTIRHAVERSRTEEEMSRQLEELQRWHKATLGREMRIIELKREVNDLLARAGQPPRYPSAEEETAAQQAGRSSAPARGDAP